MGILGAKIVLDPRALRDTNLGGKVDQSDGRFRF